MAAVNQHNLDDFKGNVANAQPWESALLHLNSAQHLDILREFGVYSLALKGQKYTHFSSALSKLLVISPWLQRSAVAGHSKVVQLLWSTFKYELEHECFMEIWLLPALPGFVRLEIVCPSFQLNSFFQITTNKDAGEYQETAPKM